MSERKRTTGVRNPFDPLDERTKCWQSPKGESNEPSMHLPAEVQSVEVTPVEYVKHNTMTNYASSGNDS